MSKEKLRVKRGITLIALVITIIVMLILVITTITVALNSGLFKSAKKATADTEQARVAESQLSSGRVNINDVWYNSLEDYVAGIKSSDQSIGGTYSTAKKNEDGTLAEGNATFIDETGTAVIPKGFKIVDGIEKDQSIAKGLVIQDSNGNEFVWIPVTFTKGEGEQPNPETGLYPSFLEVFYRSDWSNYGRGSNKYTDVSGASYSEPYQGGYSTEAEEYNNMMKSVQENGGFYIGRYEAGSVEIADKETKKPRINIANGTTGVVVKKDQYPYNFVGWGSSMSNIESEISNQGYGAVKLSKDLYENNNNVGVVSTLCYSIQWDAMLEFLNSNGNNFDLRNSTNWGNFRNTEWSIINENASYYSNNAWTAFSSDSSNTKSKTNSEYILLTTGASNDFAAKNIYDIAGNCDEWTMEAISLGHRAIRGRVVQWWWQ